MSKLQELIQKLCPDGVEYKKLGEVLEYEQPTKYIVESTDYDNSYNIPVLTAGQTFILGYTNEKFGIYRASLESPTIIFDDFTTSFHWVDFDFKIKSSAIKMLRPQKTFNGSFRYVYYAMKCIKYEAVDHSRHWISKYSQFEIPIPHPDIQEEIVRILDNFTNLAAELQAELQARQEQYEYYRDKLLSFNNYRWVEYKRLGDKQVSIMQRGTSLTKNNSTEGAYPVISGGRVPAFYCDKFNREGETITVAGSGAGAGYVQYWNEPIFVCDAFSIKGCEDVSTKYLYYYLTNLQDKIYATKKGGGVPHVHISSIENFLIPIPHPDIQEHIVSILDKFEALVNDLSRGLPAEIAAVQEQYEYYRNKLLSFPRTKVSA